MNISTILIFLVVYYLLIRPVLRWMGTVAPPRGSSEHLLKALYKVAGEIARADTVESKEELEAIVSIVRQALSNPNIPAQQIVNEYRLYSASPFTKEDVARVAPKFRIVLLQVAIQVAASDHNIDSAELKRIYHIAQIMEISKSTVDDLLNMVKMRGGTRQGKSGQMFSAVDYAFQIMQLDKNSSWTQIKKQYKRLAMKMHPDRVPEKEKATATEKFKELGDAYRILKGRYG